MTFKISTPLEIVLEGLYKSKLQDSVQPQTVLTVYEQENIRNNESPNFFRLMTIVRRHDDQTMKTQNFRARNKIVERGAVTKSQKGRKASVERKVGECHQWTVIGQCRKGDPAMIERLETDAIRDEKGQSSSPAPKAQVQTDGKMLSKSSGRRGEIPSGTRGRIPCQHCFVGKCTNGSCNSTVCVCGAALALNKIAQWPQAKLSNRCVNCVLAASPPRGGPSRIRLALSVGEASSPVRCGMHCGKTFQGVGNRLHDCRSLHKNGWQIHLV